MQDSPCDSHASDRRSFLRKGIAAGAIGVGVGFHLLGNESVLAQTEEGSEERSGSLHKGDAAMLRFAAAAEILESDFWVQYNELGGIQDNEVRGGSGNPIYTKKLQVLDSDFPQYIHDNTDDEITHFTFLNAYLESKGADPVDLEPFRTLAGSTATGSSLKPRLTNLMQLTLDTNWWTRYRSSSHNPDLDPSFKFPQAVPDLFKGQFPAIPRTDADLQPKDHIQAIANTAGFHMPTIEQGGTASIPRCPREPRVRRSYGFSSASARLKPCTSRPGRTRLAMRLPSLTQQTDSPSPILTRHPLVARPSRQISSCRNLARFWTANSRSVRSFVRPRLSEPQRAWYSF